MLAARKISTQEATAKRSFASKRAVTAHWRNDRGGNHGEILREPEPGPVRGTDPGGADRGLPRFRLPPADRRSCQWRAAVAARLLRHHLDRAALLFQLRADPDHADHSRRAEAGRL